MHRARSARSSRLVLPQVTSQAQAEQAAQAVAQAAVQQRRQQQQQSGTGGLPPDAGAVRPELLLDCSRYLTDVDEQEMRHMRMLSHLCAQTYYMGRLTVRHRRKRGGMLGGKALLAALRRAAGSAADVCTRALAPRRSLAAASARTAVAPARAGDHVSLLRPARLRPQS